MARRIVMIDDLDGTEIGEDIDPTLFSFGGSDYSIDLTPKNRAAFEKIMKTYIDKATALEAFSIARSASSEETQKIREWARAHGHEVSDRGRIPQKITDAYSAAQVQEAAEKG